MGGFAFELPDAHLELSEPAEGSLLFAESGLRADDASEDPDTQFILEGLGGLEESLASLLGKLTITPGDGTGIGFGEVGATIVAGLAQHQAPKADSTDASTHGEDTCGGCSTPSSADEQGAAFATYDGPSTPRSAAATRASTGTPNSPAESPKTTGWGAKAVDPDLPPLPARARAASSPKTLLTSVTSTVIVRNIPRHCTAADFEKVLTKSAVIKDVDFLYAPMDLKGKCGVGHMFVNLRTEEAGERFSRLFHGRTAKEIGGKGTLEVVVAPVQGRAANVQKLQRSGVLMSMLADKPVWLPRLFDHEGGPEAFPTLTD